MAEPQSLAQRIGLTRSKGALVGVLAVALLGVVYLQYGSSEGDAVVANGVDAVAPPPLPQVAAQALRVPPVTAEAHDLTPQASDLGVQTAITARFDEMKWKPPELTMVVAYDPFALPAALRSSDSTTNHRFGRL